MEQIGRETMYLLTKVEGIPREFVNQFVTSDDVEDAALVDNSIEYIKQIISSRMSIGGRRLA
jgi:hypothetical protein